MNPRKLTRRHGAQKIKAADNLYLELDRSYPCPICRQGTLEPIVLTEAWGCDRCRQIFERRAESNTIGKLSTPYHRQRNWRWDGRAWVLNGRSGKPKTFSAATVAAIGCFLWIVISLLGLLEISGGFLLGAIAISVLVVISWVLRRR